ncbi:Rhodocoxin reductase [Streptomyces sp. ADI96-02]|uniref:NAD(P)/FAD-dependent oxidoreductase n=1 Tax=Streptomyces sp. ADI96-02 TaxID=1522760 RepID=UPI000FA67E55|nr:FAD-dependent oxidoreductase [Streptomyces sp. ADI96-02]RPK67255.1 Rhodocoxin reductase [Streptomyces sp. ADI96-02]
MNRIVIVGASAGGLATAEALRGSGYEGGITLIGDEPHLPYDRPPLSKRILTGTERPSGLALRRKEHIGALGLDLRLGARATGLDMAARTVRLADGAVVPYEALVVATGVRARRLPGSGHLSGRMTGSHTLRTVEDALRLKARLLPGRRLVIVGAGFVGAEVAAVARGLGVEVTVLESAPVPMAQAIGGQAGQLLARAHLDHGVRLRTGAAVAEILSTDGHVTGVALADGSVIPADDVLVAVGSLPNTEWLHGSGLTLDDGLVCDEFSAAAPGVYGVGDAARWHNPLFGTTMRIEHRTNAAEQAIAVARNLLAPEPALRRPYAPVPYFWSDQYDMKAQAYGFLRGHDEAAVVEQDASRKRFLIAYRREDRLVGVLAAGVPPKTLHAWRALIAAGSPWAQAVSGAIAA